MSRVRYTTTIQEDLLDMAEVKAPEVGLDGANDTIKQALRIYFSNSSVEVWEKPLQEDWTKKMVIRPGRVTIETIRCRKVNGRYPEAPGVSHIKFEVI